MGVVLIANWKHRRSMVIYLSDFARPDGKNLARCGIAGVRWTLPRTAAHTRQSVESLTASFPAGVRELSHILAPTGTKS